MRQEKLLSLKFVRGERERNTIKNPLQEKSKNKTENLVIDTRSSISSIALEKFLISPDTLKLTLKHIRDLTII